MIKLLCILIHNIMDVFHISCTTCYVYLKVRRMQKALSSWAVIGMVRILWKGLNLDLQVFVDCQKNGEVHRKGVIIPFGGIMIWNTVVVQGNIVIIEFANPFYRRDIMLMFQRKL